MTDLKKLVGKEIAKRATSGEVLGVGTGSTVDAALEAIAERVRNEDLALQVVTSSLESSWYCESIGLTVLHSGYAGPIAWSFDGADAVDSKLRAIKGRGAAMLREKILAARSSRCVLIIDESKFVEEIGKHCPVPVECIPEAHGFVQARLKSLGAESVSVRMAKAKHGPVITEMGNLVLDCQFDTVADDLESRIKNIPGVVESGLFLAIADELLIASDQGIQSITVNH